jgi:hypothetical protein
MTDRCFDRAQAAERQTADRHLPAAICAKPNLFDSDDGGTVKPDILAGLTERWRIWVSAMGTYD